MSLTMEGTTTDQYRQAAKQLFDAMRDPETTGEQVDNGFKCLVLMYMAVNASEPNDSKLSEIALYENAMIIKMVSNARLKWCVENDHDVIPPIETSEYSS